MSGKVPRRPNERPQPSHTARQRSVSEYTELETTASRVLALFLVGVVGVACGDEAGETNSPGTGGGSSDTCSSLYDRAVGCGEITAAQQEPYLSDCQDTVACYQALADAVYLGAFWRCMIS